MNCKGVATLTTNERGEREKKWLNGFFRCQFSD